MKVALDVSPLRQTRAGTARYVRALLTHAQVDYDRLAWGAGGMAAAAVRDVLWYPFLLPMKATDSDVLHCPTFRGPARSRIPLVVTVHDLAVLRHPETFNRWTRAYSRVAVPRVAGTAARLIAVSEFTKREVVELLRIPEGRVSVIPNGLEEAFGPHGPVAAGDYVLAVGTLEPRKNIGRAAEAARRLGLELRVAGAPGWGRVRLPAGARTLGFVSDEELASLYRGALCLVYPSLYEGFGIPILEAMACGTPVVTSRGGATEETAGGAAVLVDPLDVPSIVAGIQEAIARRDELRAAGLERARRFDWADPVRRTADIYREVVA